MINLKLAEYEDGKFKKFLELGKDFLFGGNYIYLDAVCSNLFDEEIKEEYGNQSSYQCLHELGHELYTTEIFKKDQKDPFHRFNGLFDGRTYGDGRFVLIVDNEDDVERADIDGAMGIYTVGFLRNVSNSYVFIGETLGNLHQQPELWEKVK